VVATAALHGVLERVKRCSTFKGRVQQGLYVIEGERVVRRALAAGVEIEQLLVGEEFQGTAQAKALIETVTKRGVSVVRVPDAKLRDLSEGRNSGSCTALAELPSVRTAADWWRERSATDTDEVLLVLANVREPGNVGALMRTALASGVSALLTLGETDPYHPKAVRSSLGSLFKVRHYSITDPGELGALLRVSGIQQVAAVAEGGTRLPDARLRTPLALYVGNETQGLSTDLLAAVDEEVTIPMPKGVDSFSVNAATAIVLYEVSRRRYEPGS
jgi:TrmH family RNA methyltransferase